MTISEEGGLEELEEFFESFAICSVSLTTWALSSATSFFKAAFSASS